MSLDVSFFPYYYTSSGLAPEVIRAFERAFARSPTLMMPSESHRLWRPVRDANGGTFFSTLKQLRSNAWNRVVAESRTVALP